jgi:hypothetical protein
MVKKFRIRPDPDPHSSAARIWNTTFDILFFFFALLVKYYLRNFSWLRIIVGFFSRFFYRHNSTLNMYSTTIYIPWTKSWWKFLETINAFVFLSFCIRRAELRHVFRPAPQCLVIMKKFGVCIFYNFLPVQMEGHVRDDEPASDPLQLIHSVRPQGNMPR